MDVAKTFTLTLTRWHKVAERLSRCHAEACAALRTDCCDTVVPTHTGTDQLRRLEARATELEARYLATLEIERHIVAIRQALAQANAAHGIAVDLACYDWLMRLQRLLQALLDGQHLGMLSVGDLERGSAAPASRGDDELGLRARPVTLRLMSETFEARLRADLAGTQRDAYALADSLADRNRATLDLELPEPIARLVGLV